MRPLLAATFAIGLATPIAADTDRLIGALALPELMEIMAEEGLAHGEALGGDLVSGGAEARWSATVSALYDPEAMLDRFSAAFAPELEDAETRAMLDFFESDLGQRIIRLEVEAREALLDDDIEAAAAERLARMRDEGEPRLDLLEKFIEVNDIVESNVVGGMNANYAFYLGLSEGAAFEGRLTEDQIVADVWAQEPDIREETRDWVWSYLALAYRPLSDDELRRYIGFSETQAGQDLNRAMFAAFDAMFVGLSGEMGRAAARLMGGQDI